MKKIVVIGGGSGTFNVLRGLKSYPVEITDICTTFDSGGSTGILRDEFGVLPSGDIRRGMVALADDGNARFVREMFSHRFDEKSSLGGHSLGNLMLMAATEIENGELEGIKRLGELLQIKGRVLPMSIDRAEVIAELGDGTVINGEHNIDKPRHDGNQKIMNVYLKPHAHILRESYEAILGADMIVIGPGDLYSSLVPNLCVQGFAEAFKASQAKKVCMVNIMTKWGETNGMTAPEFVEALLSYIPADQFDYAVVNSGLLSNEAKERYRAQRQEHFVLNSQSKSWKAAKKLITENLLSEREIVRHDSRKTAALLMRLLND